MPSRREDCWTKTPPTTPGWYWWREDISRHAKIVYVTESLHSMEVFSFARWRVTGRGGEWAGPLVEPGGDAIENCPPTEETR